MLPLGSCWGTDLLARDVWTAYLSMANYQSGSSTGFLNDRTGQAQERQTAAPDAGHPKADGTGEEVRVKF